MNTELEKSNDCYIANKLTLIFDKTRAILFSSPSGLQSVRPSVRPSQFAILFSTVPGFTHTRAKLFCPLPRIFRNVKLYKKGQTIFSFFPFFFPSF